ncbi:TPA: hypothetical protein I8287_005139, partial [Kluyvera intermedia]|nr:hypothetical protein [Kluyvera intermedia]
MALRLPDLPVRSPDQASALPSGKPVGWRFAYPTYQCVARFRHLRRHPGHSPVALRLPDLPMRSPDQAPAPPSGKPVGWRFAYPTYQCVARIRRLRRHPGHSPVALRLPGLQDLSPDQAPVPPSGK